MLEVGAVVNTGRQNHSHGRSACGRRDRAQDLRELRRILIDRQHLAHLEQPGEGARHDQAVLEHVRDAARSARIIFEHQVVAGLRVAHQIDTGDVRVDAFRHADADHLAQEVAARQNEGARDLAITQNVLRPVHILQEKIQCQYALREAGFQQVPLRARKNTGNQIERKEPFSATAIAINREGDALHQKRAIRQVTALGELRRR